MSVLRTGLTYKISAAYVRVTLATFWVLGLRLLP